MQIILNDTQYTFDASAKTITLAAPYDTLDVGQIISILDVVTADVLYASESQRTPAITIAAGVITHGHGNGGQADADDLQIIVDIGGESANPIYVSDGSSTPFDNEEIDVLNIALGLTAGTYLDATRAVIALEDGRIRMWVDGSDPTATAGMIVEIGNIITLRSAAEIAGFKAIWMGAAAKLMVQYYH